METFWSEQDLLDDKRLDRWYLSGRLRRLDWRSCSDLAAAGAAAVSVVSVAAVVGRRRMLIGGNVCRR